MGFEPKCTLTVLKNPKSSILQVPWLIFTLWTENFIILYTLLNDFAAGFCTWFKSVRIPVIILWFLWLNNLHYYFPKHVCLSISSSIHTKVCHLVTAKISRFQNYTLFLIYLGHQIYIINTIGQPKSGTQGKATSDWIYPRPKCLKILILGLKRHLEGYLGSELDRTTENGERNITRAPLENVWPYFKSVGRNKNVFAKTRDPVPRTWVVTSTALGKIMTLFQNCVVISIPLKKNKQWNIWPKIMYPSKADELPFSFHSWKAKKHFNQIHSYEAPDLCDISRSEEIWKKSEK